MKITVPGLAHPFAIYSPPDTKVWGDISTGPSKFKRLKARELRNKMKKHRKRNNT